jgi:hypothetical protein
MTSGGMVPVYILYVWISVVLLCRCTLKLRLVLYEVLFMFYCADVLGLRLVLYEVLFMFNCADVLRLRLCVVCGTFYVFWFLLTVIIQLIYDLSFYYSKNNINLNYSLYVGNLRNLIVSAIDFRFSIKVFCLLCSIETVVQRYLRTNPLFKNATCLWITQTV